MTLDQINTRLVELREQKARISGMETEVYARIVGYYRSVRNWNKGKSEEYTKRVNFSRWDRTETDRPASVPAAPLAVVPDDKAQHELGFGAAHPNEYLYFFRKTCPNCPPVAMWLERSGMDGRRIDVDRESGMHEAERFGIATAPTVVFLNAEGRETGRASTVAALEAQVGLSSMAGA